MWGSSRSVCVSFQGSLCFPFKFKSSVKKALFFSLLYQCLVWFGLDHRHNLDPITVARLRDDVATRNRS